MDDSSIVPAEDSGATVRPAAAHRTRLGFALAVPCILFLAVALPMSLLTPAMANNDEPDHVQYALFIETHAALPTIGVENGDESHQPPLYYAALALEMKLIGVQHMTLSLTPDPSTATDVHLMRLPGILFGLITVMAAFGSAWLLTRRLSFSSAVASAVGLWPKFDVVSGAVSNETLNYTLCALALLCLLLWLRAERRQLLWASATGVLLGLAALTEFTSLPLAGLLLLLVIGVSASRRRWRDPVVAVAAFTAMSGWWFVRNMVLYGDPLASAATRAYLARLVPGLLCPCPGWLPGPALHRLLYSLWYDGGQNQLGLSWRVDVAVTVIAVLCLARGVWVLWMRRGGPERKIDLDLLALLLAAMGGIAAWFVIASSATQAEGRYLLVAVTAWCLLLVAGTDRIRVLGRNVGDALVWAWPAGFAILDLYVFAKFVIPLGGW